MLPNYLANIKSSGIYRFVFDKSEMPGQEAETLRLVIGYSEKGPFNTPVYVKTEDEFKKIYGGTSKKMERYGMWFHRMAIQALKAGPILAFNLKNFEGVEGDGINEVEYTTFNPNETIFHLEDSEIADNLTMAIKDLYNTDRFWTLEPEQLEEYVNDKDEEDHVNYPKGYITIATTDSKDTSVTIFMRGYEPKGYDVPFMEWYSAVLNGEELPSYLEGHERDLVSQYWAEMFIFKGQFTPEIAASDKLAKFFNVNGNVVSLKPYIVNAFGEKIDTLDALAANDASNFIKKYTGILLPDFRNASNTVISLDAQVNGDNYVHKLMMRFNQDMLYSIEPDGDFQLSDLDTTGWSQGPNNHRPMMSLNTVEPIIFTATFDGEQWNYNEGDHPGESADFYMYEGLRPESDGGYILSFDGTSGFTQTGIREGDSIFARILAHVVKITKKEVDASYWAINGKGHYEQEPQIHHRTPEGFWMVGGRRYSRDYNGGIAPVKVKLVADPADTHYNEYGVYDSVTDEEVTDITGNFNHFANDPFNRVAPAWAPDEGEMDGCWFESSGDTAYSTDYNAGQPPIMLRRVTDENDARDRYVVVDRTGREIPNLNGFIKFFDSEPTFKWIQYGSGCWVANKIAYLKDFDDAIIAMKIDDPANIHYGKWYICKASDNSHAIIPDMHGSYRNYFDSEPEIEWIQGRESYWMVDDIMYSNDYPEQVELRAITDMDNPNYGKYKVVNAYSGREIVDMDGHKHYFDEPLVPNWVRLIEEYWRFHDQAWLTSPTVEKVSNTTYTTDVQLDKSAEDGIDVSRGIYKCVGSVSATSAYAMPLYLKGYVYGNPKPATTRMYDKWQWQKYMLNALSQYKGLRIALTSRVDLEYRYLVDTFEGFVEPECKSMLSTLCKEKDNAFAILNFPAIKTFSKSHQQGGPSFRNEKGEFDTKYIAMGGNPLKPMPMMFTLPSQENGASWCGFFTALKIRDINTGIKEDVPSAALVSNNFMKKYTTYLPYTVIAGTNRGIVREQGLLGPDFNFSREDLDNLEPFGVNCMVYVDRKGTCINSNQTAKQNPVTTLSKISTRELVIFLQDEIEKLLLDYHWDFNTPNLQQRIKDRADVILETAKNNGGVYVYNNQCDEYNNTDDVINNEMFVLSTSIEPGMGAGKMVQELYIYRKGGMSSALVSDTGA